MADIVAVLAGNKFETGQAATWGEGDWDGAPNDNSRYANGGGGTPPAGNGVFDTGDIVAALSTNTFETGQIAAVKAAGTGNGEVTVNYDAATGHVSVDAQKNMSSISVESASGGFNGSWTTDGPFDVSNSDKVFHEVFGGAGLRRGTSASSPMRALPKPTSSPT